MPLKGVSGTWSRISTGMRPLETSDRPVGRRAQGLGLCGRLAAAELVVVTGKGGVGKSTLAAAIGAELRRAGRRLLLLEIDPRESLHQLLAIEPSGGEIVTVEDGLYLQNLPPRRVMDELVRERLRVRPLVRRVLESPIHHHFVEGAPGLKEIAVLGHAHRLVHRLGGHREPEIDLVVLDAPATGHGVSLLEAPALAASVISGGPIGRMARELERVVTDERRCAIVAVTTAEEMPVQEVLELTAVLEARLGRGADVVLANGLYPALPEPESGLEDEISRLWRRRRLLNDKEIGRLRGEWSGPLVELPLLPIDRGPSLCDALAHHLRESAEWP